MMNVTSNNYIASVAWVTVVQCKSPLFAKPQVIGIFFLILNYTVGIFLKIFSASFCRLQYFRTLSSGQLFKEI